MFGFISLWLIVFDVIKQLHCTNSSRWFASRIDLPGQIMVILWKIRFHRLTEFVIDPLFPSTALYKNHVLFFFKPIRCQ